MEKLKYSNEKRVEELRPAIDFYDMFLKIQEIVCWINMHDSPHDGLQELVKKKKGR